MRLGILPTEGAIVVEARLRPALKSPPSNWRRAGDAPTSRWQLDISAGLLGAPRGAT